MIMFSQRMCERQTFGDLSSSLGIYISLEFPEKDMFHRQIVFLGSLRALFDYDPVFT